MFIKIYFPKKNSAHSHRDDLNARLNEARLLIYKVDISEHLKAHSTEGEEWLLKKTRLIIHDYNYYDLIGTSSWPVRLEIVP